MENEQFQDIMLDQFAKLFNEVQEVKQSQVRTENRLYNVESDLSGVKESQARMEKRLEKVEQSQARVEKRLEKVEQSQVRVEKRLDNVESELSGVKESQVRMEARLEKVGQSQVRMETEFGKKLDALYYDWRETQKQFNGEILIEIRSLHTKVEALQMESSKHEQEIRNLYLVKAPIE